MIIKIKGRRWRTAEEWAAHVSREELLCYVAELSATQAEFVSTHETITAKVKVAKRWKLVKAFPAVVYESYEGFGRFVHGIKVVRKESAHA